MTLPVPAATAPVADGYKHVNDLRTAALAAIDAFAFVTAQPSIAANSNGDFTYTVTGLTTLQGLIIQNRGTALTAIIIRSLNGNTRTVTGTIYMPQTGSMKWQNPIWGPGNFNAQVIAWGVK